MTGAVHSRRGASVDRRARPEAFGAARAIPLSALPGAVLCTDRAGKISYLNAEAERLTGWTRASLRGRPVGGLLEGFPPVGKRRRMPFSEWLDAWQPHAAGWATRLVRRRGRKIPVRLHARPVPGPRGRITGLIMTIWRRVPTIRRERSIGTLVLKSTTADLRESEELFRSAFDASAIGMALVSLEGRYLRVNQALCQFLGRAADDLLGSDISEFNDPDEYATIVARRRQMIEGSIPRTFSYEKRFRHSAGNVLWGQLTVALARNAADQPTLFCILVQDTTERHQAEQTLRESEQRLRSMVEGLPVLMDAFDEKGLFVAWNAECERVTGYSAAEIINNPQAMELLYPDSAYRRAMFEDARKLRRLAYRGREWTLRCKDGSTKTIAWNNVGAEMRVPGWAEWGVGIDVTERRRLQIALQQASEYEQRRLGQEIHDGLGQELAALALLAHSLALTPDLTNPSVRPELGRLARIASQAVSSGRAIAHGLAPLEDKEGGLLHALRELANQQRSQIGGTEVTLQERCSAELAIPASGRSHLYRMAQEALNNAIRHAQARRVSITFMVDPKIVRLKISDDGRGITARARRAVGMGMKTMHDRATAIGGTLAVKTRAGAGTSVIIECPNLMATSEPVSFL